MMTDPFDPAFATLPATLPIFPLPGVVLLPRGHLPLNIFEPRYLAMVDDALAGERMVGMVQPLDVQSSHDDPPVYGTGCAGRITHFCETGDGRYLITLTGVSRFTVRGELATDRGYRRVLAGWDGFSGDLQTCLCGAFDRARLVAGLKAYFRVHGITADWAAIETSPEERLITSLAMICPFDATEKQALLEAPDLVERARLLITLVEMAVMEDRHGRSTCH